MRIALVSPYSWTYPGGVTRHIEALAEQFLADGHHVRVLAPYDPSDRTSARLHRGARPQDRELPEYVIPLGRTVGFPANGAVSNLSVFPSAIAALRREVAAGDFDVVHVHEPPAPMLSWDAMDLGDTALVGTFHCYSASAFSNGAANVLGAGRRFQRLHARIAVSDAAAWTATRFYGGRYSIVPNGVHVPDEIPEHAISPSGTLKIAFVGQAVERKGLPVLLGAFEGLREHVDAELTIVGAVPEEVEHLLLDGRGVTVLGRVDDAERNRAIREADVLCAPSLGGESFGMVLTEAFAQGTPVVASDIAGYRDVVRNGIDGVLVPAGDAVALAEQLRDLALAPARRAAMARAAAEHARRYDWRRVGDDVLAVYRQAIAARAAVVPQTTGDRVRARLGLTSADGRPRVGPQRLESLEPALTGSARRARARAAARRAGLGLATLIGVVLSVVALERIGVDRVLSSLVNSRPIWVISALGLMSLSMVLRSISWHVILRAALPGSRLTRFEVFNGTAIGVLMSATLPARLGEPARAIVMARRAGRPRETLPIVLGTLVSQTLLNLVALVILAVVAFSSVSVFDQHHGALLAASIAPAALLVAVLLAPIVLRGAKGTRVAAVVDPIRGAMVQVRAGLSIFRQPRFGLSAAAAQLGAWGLQWGSCYLLLVALGLDGRAGAGAAAAVLLAVNVTAVLPLTPSNVGVFQAACVAVLHAGWGISNADALGYGIVLQAVEIATAVILGAPALLREGVSWRDVRMRALHTQPVRLKPLPQRTATADAQLAEA